MGAQVTSGAATRFSSPPSEWVNSRAQTIVASDDDDESGSGELDGGRLCGAVESDSNAELDSSDDQGDEVIESGLDGAIHERESVQYHHRDQVQQDQVDVRLLRLYLDEWRGQCPFCRWHLKKQFADHPLYFCAERGSAGFKDRYERLQKLIRASRSMEQYAGCTICFVPMAWCDRFVGHGDGAAGGAKQEWRRVDGVGKCQYDEVVLREYVVAAECNTECSMGLRERVKVQGLRWDSDTDRAR